MKHTAGEIAHESDGVLVSEDGKCLMSPLRSEEELAANRAHLCLCWNTHEELLDQVKLLERSLLYEIRKDESVGDDEGARMKSATLASVRATIAKAGVQP